jgi:hypothetical protein
MDKEEFIDESTNVMSCTIDSVIKWIIGKLTIQSKIKVID